MNENSTPLLVAYPEGEVGPQIYIDPFKSKIEKNGHDKHYFDDVLDSLDRLDRIHVSAHSYLAPNGEILKRSMRPNDFCDSSKEQHKKTQITFLHYDFEQSPFWHTNIEKNNHALRDVIWDVNGEMICAVMPNRAPHLSVQEIIAFPNTRALSITQLAESELHALAELMQRRYRAVLAQGYEDIFFTFHYGPNGGGTSEHFHIQLCATHKISPDYKAIYENEKRSKLSHYNFLRQDSDLTIKYDPKSKTEIYVPLTAQNPFAMDIAFVDVEESNNTKSTSDNTFVHFNDMSISQIVDLLKATSKAIGVYERMPPYSTTIGLASYSAGFFVPPLGHCYSPMTFNFLPAINTSDIAKKRLGAYVAFTPDYMKDVLSAQFEVDKSTTFPTLF